MAARNRTPVKVLFTIDTEAWPHNTDWRDERLEGDIRRDIYGITDDGEFGLGFQASMLCDHKLRGIFFVEALFATAVGIEPLRRVLETVHKYDGQAVELHAHPEWIKYFPVDQPLAGHSLNHFHQLDHEKQISLLQMACQNLLSAGAHQIHGFRAGNFGANLDTCTALATLDVPFDFSYNASSLKTWCKFELPTLLFQPASLGGVVEFPMSWFEDYPGHIRHAELCACSFREMEHALNQAWQYGWHYFVILSHSFELIERKSPNRRPRLVRTVLQRMEKLCKFLKDNNDRFETVTCEPLQLANVGSISSMVSLRGSWLNTAARYAEQVWLRFP